MKRDIDDVVFRIWCVCAAVWVMVALIFLMGTQR